ncbi:nucleotidyltransferase substrate binding protein (TIGR01987 family) [Lonepinella koalarum]|uniref:Nucleotidyltransferase substrate binding protein (TIGR01987 family) n=1 Tax=Lonepinella koalarum TaxID=53417 RepID=A0A4R1KZW0_9PAST|nr:nucleotidyltransferase substrate binding protein (TIGR01987 family) [Lonepinella koalarum]
MNDENEIVKLDFSPLINAIERLKEGLIRYQTDISDIQIRDGLIQRFEFTYELSHKMLKRYLAQISPNPEQYDSMSFQDLIRSGNEKGLLLGEWKDWKTYRDAFKNKSYL